VLSGGIFSFGATGVGRGGPPSDGQQHQLPSPLLLQKKLVVLHNGGPPRGGQQHQLPSPLLLQKKLVVLHNGGLPRGGPQHQLAGGSGGGFVSLACARREPISVPAPKRATAPTKAAAPATALPHSGNESTRIVVGVLSVPLPFSGTGLAKTAVKFVRADGDAECVAEAAPEAEAVADVDALPVGVDVRVGPEEPEAETLVRLLVEGEAVPVPEGVAALVDAAVALEELVSGTNRDGCGEADADAVPSAVPDASPLALALCVAAADATAEALAAALFVAVADTGHFDPVAVTDARAVPEPSALLDAVAETDARALGDGVALSDCGSTALTSARRTRKRAMDPAARSPGWRILERE
jgi:hypothetical protein